MSEWVVRNSKKNKSAKYIILALIKEPQQSSKHSQPLLTQAVYQGDYELVAFLLENEVDPNTKDKNGHTPFSAAINNKKFDITKLFLEYGVEVNPKPVKGARMPPLHNAIFADSLEIFNLLLEYGADINILHHDSNQQTALHAAAQYNHIQFIDILLDAGIDVNTRSQSGYTPLHDALRHDDLNIVKALIKKGADVKVLDNSGFSILMWATMYSNIEGVKLMLELGLDTSYKVKYYSRWGSTALDIATMDAYKDRMDPEIIKMLKKATK